MVWSCCIVAQTRSREAPLPLSACAHTRAPAHECCQTQAHRSFGRQRRAPQKRAHTEPLRLRACGFFRILIPWSCFKLRFPNVQISRWRSAKPGCRSWKRVIASRSDALADCVRARARGGYSVSRPSRKSVAPSPPAPIREHGSSISEVGETGSPVTAPRSDTPADCVRARARDADAFSRRSRKSVAPARAYR